MMDDYFNGKRALVTGANRGIGKALVKELTKRGAKVVALGRNREQLAELKKHLPSLEIIVTDLRDWEATEASVQKIGHVDFLVNNAGVDWSKSILEITKEDYESVFGVNVAAVLNVTRLVARGMVSRGTGGSIVNISSHLSLAGTAERSVYCASKGAVDAFTRAAAADLGPAGVRVNAVNPTVIKTDMAVHVLSDPTSRGPILSRTPLSRVGEVKEVVDVVLFLLSDKASLINGVTLPIDGGLTAT